MDAVRIAGALGGRGCGVYGLPISSGRKGQRSWLFWTKNFPGRKGQRSWLFPTLERGRRLAVVIGIDPGVSGAIVKLTGTLSAPSLEWCHDLPAYAEKTGTGKTRRYIDGPALLKILKPEKPDLIICERMIAPPGVASNTAFSMGATMGALQTVFALHGAKARLVVSSVWKRALDCPADKEKARQMAGQLLGFEAWPLKRDHNRAEAALIALYGLASFTD